MGGSYTDDVCVAHTWRVECKYRANGHGFKRLYSWMAGLEVLMVLGDDIDLRVYTLESWARTKRAELDGESAIYEHVGVRQSNSSFGTLAEWVGGADVVAVRMPRSPWLVIEFV